MMRRSDKIRLLIDQAGRIPAYPRRGPALSSPAPTISVFKGGEIQDEILDAALEGATLTLDTYSSNVIESVGANADIIRVSDVTGLVIGERYWLQDEWGRGQEVTCQGIRASDNCVLLTESLGFAIDASIAHPKPKLLGLRMYIDVSASLLTEVCRGGRAVVTYYYRAGEPVTDTYHYDVVYQLADWPVTERDVREMWPAFPDHAGPDMGWRTLIDGARRDLELALEVSGLYADMLRNPQMAKQYICAKAIERYLAGLVTRDSRDMLTYWKEESAGAYKRICDHLTTFTRSDDQLERSFSAIA